MVRVPRIAYIYIREPRSPKCQINCKTLKRGTDRLVPTAHAYTWVRICQGPKNKVVGHRCSLAESVHQGCHHAGWTCARERSGGARAGKRTWGWLRVRRVGVIRGSACRHQPGAICNQGGGEFGAHQRSQVGQGDAPYRVGRVEYQKRFRTPWELTQEPSPGRANSLVHLPYPTAQCVRTCTCDVARRAARLEPYMLKMLHFAFVEQRS